LPHAEAGRLSIEATYRVKAANTNAPINAAKAIVMRARKSLAIRVNYSMWISN
jgi:hypothetical protein